MQDPKETLNNIEQNTEMALLQSEKIAESVDNLEPIMEGVLIKADEQVQETKKTNEMLSKITPQEIGDGATFIVKGLKGEDGRTPTTEEILSLIEPLIPEPIKGDKGDSPTDQELTELIIPLIPEPLKGEDGKDYILTENDKQEIAKSIDIPVVEKVIEKTEVIKTKIVKDTGEEIKSKLESLEVGLDYEKLSNVPDIAKIARVTSSKTVSLIELDDVNLDGVSYVNGKYVLGSGGSGGSLTGGANRIVYYDDDGNPTDDAQFTRLNNGKTLFGYTDGDGAVYENRLGGINIGFATNKDGIGATIVFGDKKAYNSTVNNSGNLTAILGVEEVDKRFAYNYVTDESIYDGVWDKETGEYSLSLQTKLGHVLTATDDLVSATEVATMFLDKKGLRFISDITGNSYYMPIGDEFDDADNGDVMTVNKSTGRVEFSAPTGGGISDAPSDGNTYGRKDASWVAVTGGGGSGMVIGDIVTGASTYRVLFTDINGDLSQSSNFIYNQDDISALISLNMDADLGKNQVKQLFGADRKTFGGLNFFGIQGSDSDTYTNALFGIADTTDVLGASGSTNSMFGQGSSKTGLTDEENAGIILNSGNILILQLEKIDTITDDTKWTIGISGAIEDKKIGFEYVNDLSGSEAEIRFGLIEDVVTYEDAIAGKTWSLPNTFPTANGMSIIVDDYTTGETVWGQPKITSLDIPIYADNATAIIGGLVATELYKTVTGEVRIVV